MNLNDRSVLTELDPNGILSLTEGFPRQCREAFDIANRVEPPLLENLPGVVALAGMGGSGAGGDFIRALFEAHGAAPFVGVKDYILPNFIGVGDVVFCCSYSGNTEETLTAYDAAKSAGAKIVAVTSGGKLKEKATEDGYVVYEVPGGQPPRTALGYMMVPVIVACEKLKLLPDQKLEEVIALLETCGEKWGPDAENNDALKLAQAMQGAVPIVYGLGVWQGYIANRWRCQINENAKHLAFTNTYPELDHNEIMGWVGASKQSVGKFVGVLLQNGEESDRMKARAKVTEGLIGGQCEFHPVVALGSTLLEQMLTLAHFGDYVSVYLARLNEVDPENIDSINTLKIELAKLD